jgi:hypothetical protein
LGKIANRAEYLPAVMNTDSANQHVNGRAGDARLATFVAGTSRFFVITGGQDDVGKVPKKSRSWRN